jgi:hypothetical protein
MRRFRLVLLVALAAALSAPVGYAAEGDTLITDPVLLTRLGFPSDARNVYLAKGAVLDQKSSPAEPKEFGTADSGWTTILGSQHQPFSSITNYEGAAFDGSILFSGGHQFFDAQFQMPSGALFQEVTWFGRDESADILFGSVYRVCQTGFPAVGNPVVTLLGSASSSNAESFTFVVSVPAGETVHNFSCAYFARSNFATNGTPDLVLRKVRAGWKRQVSLAPLSATFPNDTPTTHPYFRFIEALAASGITAGCAPGFFCPNNPITRGEMAVFLAVALGLHSVN